MQKQLADIVKCVSNFFFREYVCYQSHSWKSQLCDRANSKMPWKKDKCNTPCQKTVEFRQHTTEGRGRSGAGTDWHSFIIQLPTKKVWVSGSLRAGLRLLPLTFCRPVGSYHVLPHYWNSSGTSVWLFLISLLLPKLSFLFWKLIWGITVIVFSTVYGWLFNF